MNKKTLIICGLIVLTGLIIGGAYAYFTWNTSPEEQTDVRVVVNGLSITYEKGDDIVDAKLNPTNTKEEGIVKEVTMTLANSGNTSVCADFNLILTTLPTELRHESFKYELYKNDTLIGEGNFSDKQEGQTLKLTTNQTVTDILDTYTLYLWIDGNMDNPLEMGGKTFTFTLNANATDGSECNQNIIPTEFYVDASGANVPELFDGLIPVMWDSSNNVVKADYYNSTSEYAGYDYANQKWANAVMVTSNTRDTYINASAGTAINASDVLAYFVWIPRYRYELFNATFESGTDPQTIDITFESVDTPKSTGKVGDTFTNGQMYTHPAFTFGETELSGFWIGKFEPSSDQECTATNKSALGSECNLTTLNPRILPGVTSWRGQQVSVCYEASRKFMSETYLTNEGVNTIDSHLLKNMEWGATVYLAHSIYGKNEEITLSTSGSTYNTGGGADNAYITNVAQSTTGNVYGVYDINGGAYETVMANATSINGDSGLTISSIDPKYINIYEIPSGGTSDFSKSLHGDAMGETSEWYSDWGNFPNDSNPWFLRGGYYADRSEAGSFAFASYIGYAGRIYSFRVALTAK